MFRSLMRVLSVAVIFSACAPAAVLPPVVVSPDTPAPAIVVESMPYDDDAIQPENGSYFESLDVKESLEMVGVASEYQIGCTASMIGDGIALTAAHCIKAAPEISIKCDDMNILAFPSKVDEKSDLALLSLSMPCSRKLVKLAKEDPPQFSKIYGVGCPAEIGCEMVTSGVVGKYTFRLRKTKLMVTDMTLWHGNSGGPILNENGQVVGIADAIECLVQGSALACYSYIVPVSSIRDFLETPQVPFKLEFKPGTPSE
jgi:S1-C subfamily serine protease